VFELIDLIFNILSQDGSAGANRRSCIATLVGLVIAIAAIALVLSISKP
jgi:hypothetical protein